MIRKLIASLLMLTVSFAGYAQPREAIQTTKAVTFKFATGDNMFYGVGQGNDVELNRLYELVEQYRAQITSGSMQVYVDGYSASLRTTKANLNMAFVRANRVKSELIVKKGLTEGNFITANYATAFDGQKDVVVVTLGLPAKAEEPKPKPIVEQPKPKHVIQKPEPPAVVEKPEPPAVVEEVAPEDGISKQVAAPKTRYFALRTNLLYDALAVPNLGLEWRLNERWGIKVDAGGSDWGSETGNVQRMWYVNPEVRYYIGSAKRLYTGISGNYGEYNVYKGMLGSIFSKQTGYQGTMWNAGVVVGYQLPLGRAFALDFNLGLGYNSFSYDSFTLVNETRVYKDKDVTKNSFGVTQAGISLLWKFCK